MLCWGGSPTNWKARKGMRQTMYKVSRLTPESSFPIESLGFYTGSLWWRWGYITFDSSWTRLKQWVSLNNRRGLSRPEAPQLLVQLSEFVSCCSSSCCAHWHKILSHYLPHAFSLNFQKNSDKTKHLQLADVEQWKSFERGSGEPHAQHMEGPRRYMEKVTLNKACQEKQ